MPLAKIAKDFEAANPGIDILREAGGSTKMARMIAELGKPADIMASADYKVIDKTLIPAMADWNIRFATNQLVLCYTDKSRYADPINPGNYQFDAFYKQAQVNVTGKKPGGWITRTGQSVTYGITLVKDAPNPDGATRFLEYMLSADGGLNVLKDMGQPLFIPCRVTSQAIQDALPGNLPRLVEVREQHCR